MHHLMSPKRAFWSRNLLDMLKPNLLWKNLHGVGGFVFAAGWQRGRVNILGGSCGYNVAIVGWDTDLPVTISQETATEETSGAFHDAYRGPGLWAENSAIKCSSAESKSECDIATDGLGGRMDQKKTISTATELHT